MRTPPRGRDLAGEFLEAAYDAHAATAATGRRLDQQRQVGLGRTARLRDLDGRHAGLAHSPFGFDLGTHRGDRLDRRSDEGDAGRLDRPGKVGILRQESIAGVNRVGSRRCAASRTRSPRRYDSAGALPGSRYHLVGLAPRTARCGLGRSRRPRWRCPSFGKWRRIRRAISPRLATRILLNGVAQSRPRRICVTSETRRSFRPLDRPSRAATGDAQHGAGVAGVDDAVVIEHPGR